MEDSKLLFLRPSSASAGFALPQVIREQWNVVGVGPEAPVPPLSGFRAAVVLVQEQCRDPERLELWFTRAERLPWIALVDPKAPRQAVLERVLQRYCCDVQPLPVDPPRLFNGLRHAAGNTAASPEAASDGAQRLVGASAPMRELLRTIEKLAVVDAPVLIQGESGTGKELAAIALHERSPRAKGPFVAVNCGALPASLIQSELFGHERGAFTGAQQRKIGRVQAAHGGTIFLDEMGDLQLDLQANLLRFLQEGTIERVGGSGPIAVDARVIAATHVDLEAAVAQRRFRPDLYYRLNVLRLDMPALRERPEDVPLLARYFFHRFAAEQGAAVNGFSVDALEAMSRYAWPGNVRELLNRVRRALVMCEGRWITAADLGLERAAAQIPTLAEARAQAERAALEQALAVTGRNISHAAGLLGVSRVTLYRLLEKYQLSAAPQETPADERWSGWRNGAAAAGA